MVKAGPSFQSVNYSSNGNSNEYLCKDKVADVMARYYARIDEIDRLEPAKLPELSEKRTQNSINQRDNKSGETGTQNRPEVIDIILDEKYKADSRNMEAINKSRLKMNQTNTALEKLGKEMKKLEVGGEFLRTVRNNLDEMDRNFWSWLL